MNSKIMTANAVLVAAWKVSKYGVFSGPYFPVFELLSPNTGKNGFDHFSQTESLI